MTYYEAVVLGVVQGITEFLPISSDGHLVLAQAVLGVEEPGIVFEVLVHVGTLLSVLFFFRERLWKLLLSVFNPAMKTERMMILLLVIGTIPLAISGVLFESFYESFFSPFYTGLFLIVNGCILLITRFIPKGTKRIGLTEAILIGIGQAFAPFPGISRSGTTITTGMLAGVEPSEAAEYSFLLLIPAICGALVLKVDDLIAADLSEFGPYLAAALVAAIVGFFAVAFLLRLIRKGKFEYFAYYCFAAGIAVLLLQK